MKKMIVGLMTTIALSIAIIAYKLDDDVNYKIQFETKVVLDPEDQLPGKS